MLNRLGIDSWISAESANIFQQTIYPIGIQNGWDHNEAGKSRIKYVGDDLINAHGIVGLKERDASPEKVVEIIRNSTPSDWDDNSRPVFLSVGLFGFSNDPTTVVNALDQLDQKKYEIVHADDFFSIARAHTSGDTGPTDLNGDGLYRDVDRDGDKDMDDVRALTQQSNNDRVQNNPCDFDFNDDGNFSRSDIVGLFRDIV